MHATTTMFDPDVIADELTDVLATETTGLMRHVVHANPHVTQQTYAAYVLLKKLVHVSVEHAERITKLMGELELSPRARQFDPSVAHFSFLDLESVLPGIIKEKEAQIGAYERALEHIGDNPRCRAELEALLEGNRHHLQQLKDVIEK